MSLAIPVARVLPVEEWERLRTFGPFAVAGVLPNPAHAIVVVLEDPETKAIVGCWEATDMVMLEALYLAESHRHSPAAARRLLFGMMNALDTRGVSTAITLAQSPMIEVLAVKAGFSHVSGSLYLLRKDG